MGIGNILKRLQDIMRNDEGVNGDAQRLEQIVWILFLKVYDAKETQWEFDDEEYVSVIPEKLRWRNWAVDKKDGKALTGEELLDFINNELFPRLKNLDIDADTPIAFAKSRCSLYFASTKSKMRSAVPNGNTSTNVHKSQFLNL